MAAPILFHFDFASPYAWCALPGIERLAAEHGRALEWRPVLVWALLKAHGIGAPMEAPAKRAYFVADMIRSAAFHGVPYRTPAKLPVSSHLAARLYYVVAETDPAVARALARDVLAAFCAEGEDITDAAVLARIAERHGVGAAAAEAAMAGPAGRALLAAAIDRAVADGVIGSPFFVVDGEPFFGADRLPQIAWRLAGGGRDAGEPA